MHEQCPIVHEQCRTEQIKGSVQFLSIKAVTGDAMKVTGGDRISGDVRRWSPEADGAPARVGSHWVTSGEGRKVLGAEQRSEDTL